jgi:GntP family gluconate:H+ symporter
MFMLMAPLAKALHVRTGKNYLLYVLCVCCGGVITHSLTVPHPGPIAMVDNLKIDVGLSIGGGILAGIIPAAVGYLVSVFLNRRIVVPLRETSGSSIADLEEIISKRDDQLPGLAASLAPILLPLVLISFSSILPHGFPDCRGGARSWISLATRTSHSSSVPSCPCTCL